MDMSLFYKIYEELPRQGPGHAPATQRAFQSLPSLGPAPRFLDIGCGTGQQTVDLAQWTKDATFTALDNHAPFLATLQARARDVGVADRIQCECMDMAHMTFAPSSFDVIWSEGAIFILGFKQGLLQWRPFLRPQGFMVVSEIAWLKPEPPTELIEFWGSECPDMVEAEVHVSTITRCGFKPIDHFVLSDQAWWADYYEPLEKLLPRLRQSHQDDVEALGLLDTLQQEIAMYRKYSDYYGYIFFVMQRND